jgi:hypothetical protein
MFDNTRDVWRRIATRGDQLTLAGGLGAMAAGIYVFDFSDVSQLLGALVLCAGSYLTGRTLFDRRHQRRSNHDQH